MNSAFKLLPKKRWFGAAVSIALISSCGLLDHYSPLTERTVLLAPTVVEEKTLQPIFTKDSLRLTSFNLAHGRKQSFSQLFLDGQTIRSNLIDIAAYLKTSDSDVIALQEADGVSNWSGEFNHVEYLADQAEYPAYVRAGHVDNMWGDYGTALLAKAAFQEGVGVTFNPSPPTTRKGFTLASVKWQPPGSKSVIELDLVSLHLDFLSSKTRQSQIADLERVLKERKNPTVVMGDFNSEWLVQAFIPEALAERGFHAYQPHSEEFDSFNNKRIDWVLLTHDLEFVDYQVDDVALSDHRPVVAEIRLAAAVDYSVTTRLTE